MKKTYTTTIHLTPDDLESIIREHFGLPAKGVRAGEVVEFKVSKQTFGYGLGEMDVHNFTGADVTTTSQPVFPPNISQPTDLKYPPGVR